MCTFHLPQWVLIILRLLPGSFSSSTAYVLFEARKLVAAALAIKRRGANWSRLDHNGSWYTSFFQRGRRWRAKVSIIPDHCQCWLKLMGAIIENIWGGAPSWRMLLYPCSYSPFLSMLEGNWSFGLISLCLHGTKTALVAMIDDICC